MPKESTPHIAGMDQKGIGPFRKKQNPHNGSYAHSSNVGQKGKQNMFVEIPLLLLYAPFDKKVQEAFAKWNLFRKSGYNQHIVIGLSITAGRHNSRCPTRF